VVLRCAGAADGYLKPAADRPNLTVLAIAERTASFLTGEHAAVQDRSV
jgi:choline dehydrogenase-like flavoprotein